MGWRGGINAKDKGSGSPIKDVEDDGKRRSDGVVSGTDGGETVVVSGVDCVIVRLKTSSFFLFFRVF